LLEHQIDVAMSVIPKSAVYQDMLLCLVCRNNLPPCWG